MFFLNLTAGEFLTLLGTLSGLVTALYLLDLNRRKRVVSTLKFWSPGSAAQERKPRRRIREPWSLLLQLASLLLLLLAIAQLEWGSRRRGRDYVLLVDTSAWSAQRTGDGALLDREKQAAEHYMAALGPLDRMMLARADALAAPVTPFTSDRAMLLNALRRMRSGFSALNIEAALLFARQAQTWSGGEPGEVVYIGPAMISQREVATEQLPNLHTITVQRVSRHIGIRGIDVQRSEAGENGWQAAVTVRNYGPARATALLYTSFAGTAFAPRAISLDPAAEAVVDYDFITHTAGRLSAQLEPGGDGLGDDRVTLELPRIGSLRVAIFTDRPTVFAPLFSTNRRLDVHFYPASAGKADPAAEVMILDGTTVPVPRGVASIWINPPRDAAPLPVRAIVHDAAIRNWHAETPLSQGLHARDTRIPSAEVFQTFEGDITVAEVAEGAVIVARGPSESRASMALIGFDPLAGEARLDVTTPLLFANLLGWISPDVFRSVVISAQPIGSLTVTLDAGERAEEVRITNEQGSPVPFITAKQKLDLFTSAPETLRVTSGLRERVFSVTVPDLAPFEWKPPTRTATGPLHRPGFERSPIDLWRWLAILGGLGLATEWILFGRQRVFKRQPQQHAAAHPSTTQKERELVLK
jgi:hypothetical protein